MATDTFQIIIDVLTLISLFFVAYEFISSLQSRTKEEQTRKVERFLDIFVKNYDSLEASYLSMYADILNIIFSIQEKPFTGKKKKQFFNIIRELFIASLDNPGKVNFSKFLSTSAARNLQMFAEDGS